MFIYSTFEPNGVSYYTQDYGYYAGGSQRGGLVQKKNQCGGQMTRRDKNAHRGFNGGNEIARYVWYQMFLSKVNFLIICCILLKIQSVEYSVS